MILKGLKEKSAYKYFKKQLAVSRSQKNSKKGIHSLGCIVDLDLVSDTAIFYDLANELNLKANEIKIIGFKETVDKTSPFSIPVFSKKDMSWKGDIKNGYALEFLNNDFDLVINYYIEDKLPLMIMSSKAKAKIKVGFDGVEKELNDLILSDSLNDFSSFKTELFKYLKILKEV